MKKCIFILSLLVAFTHNLSAQDQIQIADIELKNLGDGQFYGHKQDENKTPLEGKMRIITGFTTEYIDADFKKGLAVGKWEYYKNNKLSAYTTYANGYQNGVCAELKSTGEPKTTGNYLNGAKDGAWDTYNSNGDKSTSEIYKNGSLEKKTTFYTNGNIDSERNYKNGKEHGSSKQYSLEGTLKSEKNFVNGKQVGKQTQYYSSTRSDYVQISHYSIEGKKEGEYLETYTENNALKTKGKYVKDQKHGLWITSNETGSLVKEETFNNGVSINSTKIQKITNSFKPEEGYTETTRFDAKGSKTGEYTEVYDNNKTKKKGQYLNGRMDGKWTTYGLDGKVERETIYKEGREIESK